MTAQVAVDLRAAAEVLRRDGWVQGLFHRRIADKFCHCAEGAIHLATGTHFDLRFEPAIDGGVDYRVNREANARRLRVRDVLSDFLSTSVPRWNDAPGRTADEVIGAMEAAATAAERQAAYDEGRWCGECQYGVVNDPPCCTQGPVPS